MKDLLFLTHRIPYPPNKGDKVRSYHLLRFLADRYRVHMGTFIDNPDDWEHVDKVRRLCADAFFVPISPRSGKLRSLYGLCSGEALTLHYFRSQALKSWVKRVMVESSIQHVLSFSAAMAQYVAPHLSKEVRSILDFVDVDSSKWRQYADRARWPNSAIYRRESQKLLRFEREMAHIFDVSVFVSREEAELFSRLAPSSADRIACVNNGVDYQYFSPSHQYKNPYAPEELPIVFTGAMDYWANVDAVRWFSKAVFPSVYSRRKLARFYIVGARPTKAVKALTKDSAVQVVGSVGDVRPWLAHAKVVVAPLRIAQGIQNKVLEAMSMGRPVVVTPAALTGLKVGHGLSATSCTKPNEFARTIVELLRKQESLLGASQRRQYVIEHYDWSKNLRRILTLLEPASNATADEAAAAGSAGSEITLSA